MNHNKPHTKKTYVVHLKKTLSTSVILNADSPDEAKKIAVKTWLRGIIKLQDSNIPGDVEATVENEEDFKMKNHGFPDQTVVERLRKQFPAGSRVELISMSDPYAKLKPGDRGTVEFVDDIGTVFVKWDCGSGLGVAYGEDHIRKI